MHIEDRYGRKFETLRVSLINTCNLGCIYCVNGNEKPSTKKDPFLDYTSLADLVIHLDKLLYLKKIRITGGEPTLYKDLIPFISILSLHGIENISMTTNGYLLQEKIKDLAAAGLKEVNISLDAVDENVFEKISGRKNLHKIVEFIDKAIEHGLVVKLNAVIMKGINDSQVLPLLDYAISKNIKLRYLELMRMGHYFSSGFDQHFYSQDAILKDISTRYDIQKLEKEHSSTACYWKLNNQYEFGIIANESEPFCSDCNRLRLDSAGNIFGCLSENKSEFIADIYKDEIGLSQKLNLALDHKQSFKFKGSDLKMISIGG